MMRAPFRLALDRFAPVITTLNRLAACMFAPARLTPGAIARSSVTPDKSASARLLPFNVMLRMLAPLKSTPDRFRPVRCLLTRYAGDSGVDAANSFSTRARSHSAVHAGAPSDDNSAAAIKGGLCQANARATGD